MGAGTRHAACILTGIAVATGISAQASAEAQQLQPTPAAWYRHYLRDGKPVSLPDGRTLNLYCLGSGSPTVILESGISESAFTWWAVQEKIARSTRVCAYDRAGLGRSPPGPFPRDMRAEVQDLENLLRSAELPPPYVLVGHSMGAMHVRLFASRHLEDVAAIVLVDPSVEDQLPMLEGALPAIAANDQRQLASLRACAEKSRSPDPAARCTRDAPDDFPTDLAEAYKATFGPSFFQTVWSEAESFVNVNSRQLTAESRSLGSIPLHVLTRGALSSDMPKDQAEIEWKLWKGLHDKMAGVSIASSHRVIEGSGHYIHIDKPDAVVDAVVAAVSVARKSRAAH